MRGLPHGLACAAAFPTASPIGPHISAARSLHTAQGTRKFLAHFRPHPWARTFVSCGQDCMATAIPKLTRLEF